MASIEKTRAIVEEGETYDGKIVPTVKAEIGRPVRIYEGATVQGSVYGETVEIKGGTVEGSVMGAESVEFEDGSVEGEVGADGKVAGSGATVYGTVTGTRIRLTDAIVYGNVVGTDVILENCAVIGIVSAERKLVAQNSLVYTFKSYGQTKLNDVSTVLPQAVVEGEIELASPVTVTGFGRLELPDEGMPTMDMDDLIEVEGSTYLSLSPRILNLEEVTDRLEELEGALDRVATATSADDVPPAQDLLETLGVDQSQYPAVV
ncbi:bactofilin family protein [Halapricum desulfuricans]|uniref:Putative acyltransferase n=1 Tax=Halapricum desulfuricans TaxID=2841257 RepID=A0A897N6P9_9EURY|nr:polymer-forming cytoskeletal protein [Halapricum desulfuricans]QSG08472.1 putative acyltransferase [Halapricum desulfuricans]